MPRKPPSPPALRRRATLKDVAKAAGVSSMTVSNVINGTMRGYNADTRDRVLRVAERLNYRPDIAARSLRTDRRMAVGMLVVQQGLRFLGDPYITNLLDGLCASLNQRGYSLVLQGLQPNELVDSPLVRQLHTDGLCILMSADFAADDRFRKSLRALRQPIVLFQQTLGDLEGDICVLRQDDFEGGRALCEHLVQRGAKRILAVVPQLDWPAMRARVGGASHYLKTSRAKTKLEVVTSIDESSAATQGAIDGRLSAGKSFDAVLAANDQMAIAAYRLLTRRGFRIPEDIKLTGFNGFEFLDYFGTRLTTVRSPAFELGNLGAHQMVNRIETGRFESQQVILPTDLVVGTTT